MSEPKNPSHIESLFKFSQIVTPLVLGALIPWSSWITYKVIAIDEWKNQGRRLMQQDAESIKLEMKNFYTDQLAAKMENVDTRLKILSADMIEVKILLREKADFYPSPKSGTLWTTTNTYGVTSTPLSK